MKSYEEWSTFKEMFRNTMQASEDPREEASNCAHFLSIVVQSLQVQFALAHREGRLDDKAELKSLIENELIAFLKKAKPLLGRLQAGGEQQ